MCCVFERGIKMKKRYVFVAFVVLIVILFFVSVLFGPDKNYTNSMTSVYPRIGQKAWTYNMNKHEWRDFRENDDELSKEEIILQVKGFEGNGGYTTYQLLTGNAQVPKEDVWIGEGSQEFLRGKSLYSYFPKNFEYYEVIFNGVKFVPKKLTLEEVEKLFDGYKIIKVSDLQKGTFNLKYSKKENNFIVLNDVGEDFYKYYIVPNDSKDLEIEEFSNQFEVNGGVDIKIQRLEGCSKAYPCYEISIKD